MANKCFYVYKFLDDNNNIIYIGKAKNLNHRIINHFGKFGHLPKECYKNISKIEYCIFNTNTDMSIFEIYMINKYRPIYNIHSKYNENINNCIFQL
jgi:excinuclease UvrABC nuclease subunit